MHPKVPMSDSKGKLYGIINKKTNKKKTDVISRFSFNMTGMKRG